MFDRAMVVVLGKSARLGGEGASAKAGGRAPLHICLEAPRPSFSSPHPEIDLGLQRHTFSKQS